MKASIPPSSASRADDFGRRHPRMMLALIALLVMIATAALLGQREAAQVLYENF